LDATLSAIELVKTEYLTGQVFYASTDKKFYKLTVAGTTYTLTQTTEYIVNTGRQDLYFQYKHNSGNSKRIDPAITNIIDLYLATSSYYTNIKIGLKILLLQLLNLLLQQLTSFQLHMLHYKIIK